MSLHHLPRSFWTKHGSSISDRNVLADMHNLLTQPILGVKGWGQALLTGGLSEEERQKSLKWILDNAEYLESLNEALGAYLEQYSKHGNST